jgi:hypothetical protein
VTTKLNLTKSKYLPGRISDYVPAEVRNPRDYDRCPCEFSLRSLLHVEVRLTSSYPPANLYSGQSCLFEERMKGITQRIYVGM